MANSPTRDSEQSLLNQSFDYESRLLIVEPASFDGTSMLREVSKQTAVKITVVAGDTYVAKAPIGSDQASAVWQAKKISTAAGTTTITWADGNANFDNVSTDLTILTYS